MAAFDIPLSGLEANSSWLSVISNNLANLNTDGYKDESVGFGDIFNEMQGTSGSGDPIQIGNGVEVGSTSSNFSDGNVSSTGTSSNMAIQGNGFFVTQSPGGQVSYTRDGDFTVNAQGQLITAQGQLVQGYQAVNGVISSGTALAPISVSPSGTIPGNATTTFTTDTNLDSSSGVGATFNTPITVYDSLGAPQTLTVQYTNTGTNAWSYTITLPAAATGSATATTVGSGTMTFDSSGKLTAPSGSVTGIDINGLTDGAAEMKLTWNLNNAAGNPTITQLDSTSATNSTTQDGFGVGTLTGYTVDSSGTIEGQFSNNQTQALGQVALASFGNVQGLVQTSNGNYQPTVASGAALLGQAGAGGNGTIEGAAVEDSNVDLSTEFANLIVAQQGYEANAKALTAFDQVSQATIQLIS